MITEKRIETEKGFVLMPDAQPWVQEEFNREVPLFVYGTLLCPAVIDFIMRFEEHEIQVVKPDWITGYKLKTIEQDGETYLQTEYTGNDDDIVSGGIIYVWESDIAKFDEFEGEDYMRVPIHTQDGSECEIYVKR